LVSFQPKVHLGFDRLYKGGYRKNRNRHPPQHGLAHLLVATTITRHQKQASADHKTQSAAKPVGSCCAKGPSYNN